MAAVATTSPVPAEAPQRSRAGTHDYLAVLAAHGSYVLVAAYFNHGLAIIATGFALLSLLATGLLCSIIRSPKVFTTANSVLAGCGFALVLVFAGLPGPHPQRTFTEEFINEQNKNKSQPSNVMDNQ